VLPGCWQFNKAAHHHQNDSTLLVSTFYLLFAPHHSDIFIIIINKDGFCYHIIFVLVGVVGVIIFVTLHSTTDDTFSTRSWQDDACNTIHISINEKCTTHGSGGDRCQSAPSEE
jgi:hypothetical protein